MSFNIHTKDGSMSAFCILADVSKDKFQEAALKTLQAARTTSSFVRECQKAVNDISTRHTVGPYWVPVRAGYEEMKSLTSSQGMVLFNCLLDGAFLGDF